MSSKIKRKQKQLERRQEEIKRHFRKRRERDEFK
jgi:hypothetical protein